MLRLLKNKTWSFLEILMAVMFGLILLPSNIKAISIIVFGIYVLIYRIKKGWFFNKKLFFTNTIVYLFLLITLLYSKNISYAIFKLQTMSPLFFFPLIFSLFTPKEIKGFYEKKTYYLIIFIIGVFLLNSFPFLWYWTTHYSLEEVLIHYPMVIQVGIGKYGIHPIYLSIYISLSILFSVFVFKSLQNKKNQISLIIVNGILAFFLFLYARKSPIIALLITFFVWSYLINNKRKQIYLFGIIFLTSLLIFLIPTTRKRFVELLSITTISKGKETSSNIRYTLNKTSLELIKIKPFLGYGIGSYNDEIIKINKQKGYLNIARPGYNSHNQYLSLFLIGGVFLFMFFLYFFQKNIQTSLKEQNYILVLILVYYGVSMFTENILERENGVIYFSLFINFFGLKNYKENEE